MRLIRLLLLIVALIVGQAQAGRAVFVCVDGGICKRCSAERTVGHDQVCKSVTKKTVDKKNCCKAKPDDKHHESEKAVSPHHAEAVAGVLPSGFRFLGLSAPVEGITPRHRYVSYLPQAPPGEQCLRAPPFLAV